MTRLESAAQIDSAVKQREKNREVLVNLTFALFWIALFEGALRKWAFPGIGKYIYFLRDPVLFVIYLLAMRAKFLPKKSFLLTAGGFLAVAAIFLIMIQSALSEIQFSWLLAIFGWHSYFIYLPLPFFMSRYLTIADIDHLIKKTLFVAIPIGLLVVLQFKAPAGSVINNGRGTQASEQYNVGFQNGRAPRTSGTFTSALGQECFTECLFAMTLAMWLRRRSRRPVSFLLLLAATGAALICIALSGNRGVLIGTATILFFSGVALLASGRRLLFFQALFAGIAVVPVALLLLSTLFPEALEANLAHIRGAGAVEERTFGELGTLGRVLFQGYGFIYLLPVTPLEGFGMGLGTNAASLLTNSPTLHGASIYFAIWLPNLFQRLGAETGWGRHITDMGPILGFAFILYRIALTTAAAFVARRAAARSRDVTALVLLGFSFYHLFVGLLTANGTVGFYALFFLGVAMAVSREQNRVALAPMPPVFLPRRRRLVTPKSPQPVPVTQ